jgi:hypothetical protein
MLSSLINLRFSSNILSKGLLLITILVFPSLPPLFSSVEHTVTFTLKTTTVIREIQFNFRFRFGIVSSLEMFAGESRDLIVHVTKGYTYITTEQPHSSPFTEEPFPTPIGDLSKTVVGTYIRQGIDVYIKVFNATLLIGIKVEGSGAVSPRALMWNAQNLDIGASGSITVKHTNLGSS